MSVAQEFRTIQAQLEARTAELQNAHTSIQILESTAGVAQTTISEQAALIANQSAALAVNEASMQALRDEHTAATTDLTARVATLEADNAAMQTKLSNPAFARAAAVGEDPAAVRTGGEAGSESTPTWAQYNAIKDPAARNAFWEANQEKLQAEQQALASK